MICKICNSNLELKAKYKKPQKEEKIFTTLKKFKKSIYACIVCNHHIIKSYNYNLNNKIYKNLYGSKAYGDLERKFNIIKNIKKKNSSNFFRKKFIIKNIKINREDNVLDFGSGLGIFPFSINKICRCYFYEKNIMTKNFCIKVLKLNYLPLSKIKRKKFDLITCNKVLEHLNIKEIKNTLDLFRKSLKKEGKIYLELPSSYASREGYFRQEFFSEHINVFSKKSINIFFKSLKFRIDKLRFLREINGKFTFRIILSCL